MAYDANTLHMSSGQYWLSLSTHFFRALSLCTKYISWLLKLNFVVWKCASFLVSFRFVVQIRFHITTISARRICDIDFVAFLTHIVFAYEKSTCGAFEISTSATFGFGCDCSQISLSVPFVFAGHELDCWVVSEIVSVIFDQVREDCFQESLPW